MSGQGPVVRKPPAPSCSSVAGIGNSGKFNQIQVNSGKFNHHEYFARKRMSD
jgi:hypothetical protein